MKAEQMCTRAEVQTTALFSPFVSSQIEVAWPCIEHELVKVQSAADGRLHWKDFNAYYMAHVEDVWLSSAPWTPLTQLMRFHPLISSQLVCFKTLFANVEQFKAQGLVDTEPVLLLFILYFSFSLLSYYNYYYK